MKPTVIAIVGTTASGKSSLGISLAQKFNGEVISADSRQVYRGLDAGSGKVTKREMLAIPHHLLDVADPKNQFSVAQFKELAEQALRDITSRGKLPIVVGGTGLYIDTLLQNMVLPQVAPDIKLRKKLEKKSASQLFSLLTKLDPARAKNIDKHNRVRLIRSIEIAEALGSVPKIVQKNSSYDVLSIGLTPRPESLKKRISVRLSKRLPNIIKEVKQLHAKGVSWKRLEGLGLEYRSGARYVRGHISKKEMEETLEKEIWQYAKRQMTWFKRNKAIHWFDPDKKSSQKDIEQLVRGLKESNPQ